MILYSSGASKTLGGTAIWEPGVNLTPKVYKYLIKLSELNASGRYI